MVLGKDEIEKLAADGRLWVDLPTGAQFKGILRSQVLL